MKFRTLTRFLTPILLLFACLVLGSVTTSWTADHNSLIVQAREQLQNEQFVEALATAKDAVRANAKDYKGHYYIAMAYMGMDRFDDAEASVARALKLAPAGAKPGVEKLAAAIKIRRQGTGLVQAAETALADGMAGKAASLYEQAWNAGQDSPDLGLKAADLYANRLNQSVDAGRVLRQVIVAAKGNPAADRAGTELKKLADKLRKLAEDHVAAARKQQGEEALQSLQLAEYADPTYLNIYKLRAQQAAEGDNIEALQAAIKDLARHDHAQPHVLAELPHMTQWMHKPTFKEFLTDLLGRSGVDNVDAAIKKRDADIETAIKKRAAYDAAAIKEREAKKAFQARVDGAWAQKTLRRTYVNRKPEIITSSWISDQCQSLMKEAYSSNKSAQFFGQCDCEPTYHPAYGNFPKCTLEYRSNYLLD